ncbi:hypothetical protein BP5796_10364 [Coleophoma crateriformis]|uniref:SMP-LTD domain-containing protein n=1 Tax=Coleophoma crateriformis TaxID=565419 RepID=A0A3D8QPZ6_9HELO|nr:hypothetical protein BP5796_10364 [Coleophoma crateriformis]
MGGLTGLTGFLFVYVLGGLTFLPLLLLAVLAHAYFTFPIRTDALLPTQGGPGSIVQESDDLETLQTVKKTLAEKFRAPNSLEPDVAEGWFAVCREYTPGGVNGAPPERKTPVGSTTVSAASPSVYQSMYRSIFERKQVAGPLDNKGVGRPQRKGGNVFYVVLRHGHLMLFDDDDQIEVRHVVSLAHHNVSIFSGEKHTPEGELFIKRNAICLSRRTDAGEVTVDGTVSKPFFFFSENCSDKEDFYFALLRNQERKADAKDNPPIPLQYDVKDMITLVQRLHSSEEHLQTRWINAVIGRIFLALYKTPEVENFIRAKFTKKLSRVKKPSFLSRIVLQKIDLGDAAPVITNPRLKDLTVDGELMVEADVRYAGNFRLEVAAIARIELGTRFKAREVNLLLAAVLKRIEGHVLIRIKPPPSNRIWMTFQTMPKIDMSIEPIVSARQITYTLILRQIENRIKEVIAESLVFPNWDDSPFYQSESKDWRGGIWATETKPDPPPDAEQAAAEEGDVDEVQNLDGDSEEAIEALLAAEKSMSMPNLEATPVNTTYARKAFKSAMNLNQTKNAGSSTSVDTMSPASDKPRLMRSGSFASASPSVGTDTTHAETFKPSSPPEQAGAMAAISALSQSNSPAGTPVGSPLRLARTEKAGSYSSVSSQDSSYMDSDSNHDLTPQPTAQVLDNAVSSDSCPTSPSSIGGLSFKSESVAASSIGKDMRRENTSSSSNSTRSAEARRISLAAVTNAAATAKKWGWNAIQQRTGAQNREGSSDPDGPAHPIVMGRGRPLPPPGTPLPPPDRRTKTAPIPVPKRKAIPTPSSLTRKATEPPPAVLEQKDTNERRQVPPLPLPPRPNQPSKTDSIDDGLLVVEAPRDSAPASPVSESVPTYVQPWAEDDDEQESPSHSVSTSPAPPRLPKRRHPSRVLSGSPEEDNQQLPSWVAAQEEEARSKSIFVDEDSGL